MSKDTVLLRSRSNFPGFRSTTAACTFRGNRPHWGGEEGVKTKPKTSSCIFFFQANCCFVLSKETRVPEVPPDPPSAPRNSRSSGKLMKGWMLPSAPRPAPPQNRAGTALARRGLAQGALKANSRESQIGAHELKPKKGNRRTASPALGLRRLLSYSCKVVATSWFCPPRKIHSSEQTFFFFLGEDEMSSPPTLIKKREAEGGEGGGLAIPPLH